MTHHLTLYCLKKLQAKNHLSDEELVQATYNLEFLFINVFKGFQVYSVALILGTFKETLIMNLSYILLRKHAGGWHANSSLNCSLISIASFVGIPYMIIKLHLTLSTLFLFIISIILFSSIYRFSPSDTEKNPFISISDRKIRRKKSLYCLSIQLTLMFIYPNLVVKALILAGLLMELVIIHPFFYKLTKSSYNNYKNYVNID